MIGATNMSSSSSPLTIKNLSISLNGSNTITYDGSAAKSINITPASIGAAVVNHGHYNIPSKGRSTALTGSQLIPDSGISIVEVYDNGYPVSYGNVIRVRGSGSSELLCEWAGTSGAYAGMRYRSQRDSERLWSNWVVVLDSVNYNNYAAAKSHTHPKSQITDFPGSLPANGGNSDTVDGYHASSFVLKNRTASTNSNINTLTESGFYRINSGHTNTPGDWGQLIVCHGGGDTIGQLYFDYISTIIKFRSGNPPEVNGSGKWTAWTEVIDRTRFNPTKIQSGTPVTDALWAW